jgi:hypothetical protein
MQVDNFEDVKQSQGDRQRCSGSYNQTRRPFENLPFVITTITKCVPTYRTADLTRYQRSGQQNRAGSPQTNSCRGQPSSDAGHPEYGGLIEGRFVQPAAANNRAVTGDRRRQGLLQRSALARTDDRPAIT